jgi:hypothetical protein
VTALLGKAGIVDDPSLDRTIALDHRQDLLANAAISASSDQPP